MEKYNRELVITNYYMASNALMEIGISENLPKELDEIVLRASREVVKILNYINENRTIED